MMRGTTLVTGTSHRGRIGGRGEGVGGFSSFASVIVLILGSWIPDSPGIGLRIGTAEGHRLLCMGTGHAPSGLDWDTPLDGLWECPYLLVGPGTAPPDGREAGKTGGAENVVQKFAFVWWLSAFCFLACVPGK